LVGAVAAEAGVGEDGADIAVETYFRVKGEAEEGDVFVAIRRGVLVVGGEV
jgi:hypothetical protein